MILLHQVKVSSRYAAIVVVTIALIISRVDVKSDTTFVDHLMIVSERVGFKTVVRLLDRGILALLLTQGLVLVLLVDIEVSLILVVQS